MLGISFSELIIIAIAMIFFMKPQDIAKVARWYKYVLNKINEIKDAAHETLDEFDVTTSNNTSEEYVIDADNKLQKTCSTDITNNTSTTHPS